MRDTDEESKFSQSVASKASDWKNSDDEEEDDDDEEGSDTEDLIKAKDLIVSVSLLTLMCVNSTNQAGKEASG